MKVIDVRKYSELCGGIIAGTLSSIRELKLDEEAELYVQGTEEEISEFRKVIETLSRLGIVEIKEWKDINRVVLKRRRVLV